MKIVDAKVIVSCPGRNYVTLKITTEDGIHGIGDATLNGRELAVASYLRDHLCPMLIGQDARNIEDLWQLSYRGAYWRRGPVTMAAIAAIDVALWDIKGKALNTPVWNLLGGRTRTGILCYVHASARSTEELVEVAQAWMAQGYRAVRTQCLAPGMEEMYGIPRAAAGREGVGLPYVEQNWSSEKYLRFVPGMFDRLRDALGWDVHLLHDSHHRLTVSQAGWLGKRLEDHQLFWLEDTVPAELQRGYRQIRAATTTPLAVGEVFNSVFDCEQLITEQLIDYIRTAIVHAGGITQLRKIAALAEPYGVRTGCHGAADLSPVTMGAAVHFGVATHNAAIQEYNHHPAEAAEVFDWDWSAVDGYLVPGDRPGIGVDIDEAAAARFEYQRAYLPISRLTDGSVGNY
jgi:mannonate dehydratase